MLRKINAGLSLITTFLLMDHAIFLSIWMLSRCSIEKRADNMPWILVGLMVIHVILIVVLIRAGHTDKERIEGKPYFKMNATTYVQRFTAVLLVILLGLHILGAANYYQPQMLHAILHPVFFAVALAHASVSTSKALITLGIGNAKIIKIVDILMIVICTATFIAGVVGFYLCLFVGVAK